MKNSSPPRERFKPLQQLRLVSALSAPEFASISFVARAAIAFTTVVIRERDKGA